MFLIFALTFSSVLSVLGGKQHLKDVRNCFPHGIVSGGERPEFGGGFTSGSQLYWF